MHILIVGGAGFIGARLAALLLEAGHIVTVLDNLQTGRQENLPPAVSFLSGDAADAAALEKAFVQPVDIVFYAVPAAPDDPQLQALTAVLQAAETHGVQKVIYFSSAAVYGEIAKGTVTETQAPAPLGEEGKAYVAAENRLRDFGQKQGLAYAILRCANVYGDGAGSHGVMSELCRNLLLGRDLVIYGDGNQSRDFVYVQDVARAAVQAMAESVADGVYNISTNIETTVNALKEILLYFSHLAAAVSYAEAKDGEVYRSVLDNRKAIAALNWRPKTKLMPGIMATYQYFLTQLEKGALT